MSEKESPEGLFLSLALRSLNTYSGMLVSYREKF